MAWAKRLIGTGAAPRTRVTAWRRLVGEAMDAWWSDLKSAFRVLHKNPTFAAVAILTVGIGTLLSQRFPFPEDNAVLQLVAAEKPVMPTRRCFL